MSETTNTKRPALPALRTERLRLPDADIAGHAIELEAVRMWRAGDRIRVCMSGDDLSLHLTREQAERLQTWLDEVWGKVGDATTEPAPASVNHVAGGDR